MPARSFVPSPRDIPGARLVGLLSLALAALTVAAIFAWNAVRDYDALARRRFATNQYIEAVLDLRVTLQELALSGRAYAITGDAESLAAAEALSTEALAERHRVRALSVGISAPDRIDALDIALDTLTQRLRIVRSAGGEGVELARAFVRTQSGPQLLQTLFAVLDGLRADALREREAVLARAAARQRTLALWLPAVAALAIGLGAVAVLLLRAQARARAEDLTRFRAIFDNTFQFIGLLSPDGTLLEANHTALAFAGVRHDAVLGRPFWETPWWSASADTREQLRAAIARAAAGEFVRYGAEVNGAGGRRVTIDFSLKPVLDTSGRVTFIVPEGRDVTEQRRVEAEARRLQGQLESLMRFSPSLIAVLDPTGRYLQVSESIAQVLARPAEEIVGRSIDDLLPLETAATFRRRLEQVQRTARAIDVEDTVGNPGDERRYRTVLFPMRDEGGTMFAIGSVAINITDAHRAMQRLEQALDENRILQGLLSICAQCKRIQDKEDDSWKPVESYVQSHSAAVFSHGLCPTCTETFIRENGLDSEAP